MQLKSKEVEGKKKENWPQIDLPICNLVTYGVKRKQYKQQTIKIATEKQRSSREEEEKPTSNRLSNSSCNLVILNRLSKSI